MVCGFLRLQSSGLEDICRFYTGFPISGIFVEAWVQKEVPRCGDWGGLKAQGCLSNVRV